MSNAAVAFQLGGQFNLPPGLALDPRLDADSPYGMFRHLEHDLFHENEHLRMLDQARRAIGSGQLEDAAELLQAVLSLSGDSFITDADAQTISSLRASASDLLKAGSPELRQTWKRRVELFAVTELDLAMSHADRSAIRRVAHQFPFTDAGVRAAKLVIVDLRLRAQFVAATQYALLWAQLYEGHAVYFTPFNLVAQELLAERSSDHHPQAKFVRLSSAVRNSEHQLSPPWPKPVWSWSESLSAGHQRSNEFRLPAPRLQESTGSSPDANFVSSIPLLRGDTLIFRASSRLLCFEKMTGRQLWQIQTDNNASSDVSASGGSRAEGLPGSVPVVDDWITSRANFGMLAGDEQYVFFIDHFRSPEKLRRQQPMLPGRRGFPGLPNLQPENDPLDPGFYDYPAAGNRLVALKYPLGSASPVVAWTIGSKPTQPYTVTVEGDRTNSEHSNQSQQQVNANSTIHNLPAPQLSAELKLPPSNAPGNDFADHQFLCVPSGNDSQLYVLTATTDQVWANSIDRHNGRLRWRQPLVYDHDILIERMLETPSPENVDLCLLVNDLVICVLSSGTVVGLRQADGQPQWAASLRDHFGDSQSGRLIDRGYRGKSSTSFLPAVAGTTLICSSPQSTYVYAINTIDGRIRWKVRRSPENGVEHDAGYDTFLAGIDSNRVILMGRRHCRALSLQHGSELWITDVIQPTGRAWCDHGRCLVLESDGRVAQINTLTGDVSRVSENLLPDGFVSQTGSMSGDDDVVVVGTQESATVLFRSDMLLRNLDQVDSLKGKLGQKYLAKSQAYLLTADNRRTVETLKQAFRELRTIEQRQQLNHFAAEFLLQYHGRQILAVHQPTDGHNRKLFDANGQLSRDFSQLEGLQLSRDQQIHLQLLQTLGQQRADQKSQQLPALIRDFRLGSLISVDGDWQTHPSMLVEADLPERWKLTSRSARMSDHLGPGQIEAALLNRDLLDNSGQLADSIRKLHRRDEASAELLLLASLRRRTHDMEQVPQELQVLLHQIHQEHPPNSDLVGRQTADQHDSNQPSAPADKPPIQTLTLNQQVSNWTPDSFNMEVGLFQGNIQMPFGSPLIWRKKEGFSGNTTIAGFDPVDGSRTDEVEIPFSITDSRIAENNRLAPRLILVCGHSEVGVVSAVRPGSAKLLWHKRVREIPLAGVSGILPGPIGPDFAIWQSGRRLNCSHPLTGRLLWSRECFQAPQMSSRNSMNPLFGDEHVIVVLDSDRGKYRRYRTRDGYLLGAGVLTMSANHPPVVVGRKLLYKTLNDNLRLFDPLSVDDQVEFPVPIEMYSANSLVRVLSDGKVVAVTGRQEIVLLDTNQKKGLFRIPVSAYLKTPFPVSMSVFERNDRLFVFVNDEQNFDQRFRAVPLFGEPRVDYGWLFCIDPDSGTLNWAIQTDPSVMLPIHGDRTELLIASSIVDDFGGQSSGRTLYRSESRLRIQVFDQRTGALLLERVDLFPEFPLRCVHYAETGETKIFMRSSVITISATEQ